MAIEVFRTGHVSPLRTAFKPALSLARRRELIADLEKADWLHTGGGKGSHRKFAHPDSQRKIILSGASGGDAHPYQEKLVKAAVREVRK